MPVARAGGSQGRHGWVADPVRAGNASRLLIVVAPWAHIRPGPEGAPPLKPAGPHSSRSSPRCHSTTPREGWPAASATRSAMGEPAGDGLVDEPAGWNSAVATVMGRRVAVHRAAQREHGTETSGIPVPLPCFAVPAFSPSLGLFPPRLRCRRRRHWACFPWQKLVWASASAWHRPLLAPVAGRFSPSLPGNGTGWLLGTHPQAYRNPPPSGMTASSFLPMAPSGLDLDHRATRLTAVGKG